MMTRLHCFLIGVLVGAGAVLLGTKYHIVRAEDGLHAIPKVSSELQGAYVDIRDFTAEDWIHHQNLSLAIMKAEKGYLLSDSATGGLRRSLRAALESLGRERER
jgi:uncharacterized protein with ACT and thioredoxin-like domain